MVKIKNLALLDKKKLTKLSSFLESELDLSAFHSFPLDFFHNLLPFKFKFMEESFVFIEDKKVNGLITINKAGDRRVKIKRLLLDKNAYETGKTLVNYILSKYLTKGAEAFYVVADKKDFQLISMFKEGCGFQNVGEEIVYRIENKKSDFGFDEVNFDYIRKMKNGDINKISSLYDNLINSYKKPFFLKTANEIKKEHFFNKEKYVLCDENNKLVGFFAIISLNKEEFLLDFIVDSAFEGYATDIVKFTQAKLINKNCFKTLYIKLKNYYTNFDELAKIFNMEYVPIKENQVLYKGFLTFQKKELKYEKMIFNDITPAF